MLQLVRYGLPAFAGGLRRTGKVYDKRMTSLHANSAREHGAARLGHRVRTDRLGNTRHVAVADGTRRLGRHITHRKPRAAAGEHDIGVALIGGFHNGITDLADVVAHDHMRGDHPALRLDKFLECGSSLVLGKIARIRARHDRYLQLHSIPPTTRHPQADRHARRPRRRPA